MDPMEQLQADLLRCEQGRPKAHPEVAHLLQVETPRRRLDEAKSKDSGGRI